MKPFRYLYFIQLLLWQMKKGEQRIAHINASLSFAALLNLNAFLIVLIYGYLFGKSSIYIGEIPKLEVGIVFLIFQALTFLSFGRKKISSKIYEEFSNSKSFGWHKKVGVFYIIISFLIPIIFMIFTI